MPGRWVERRARRPRLLPSTPLVPRRLRRRLVDAGPRRHRRRTDAADGPLPTGDGTPGGAGPPVAAMPPSPGRRQPRAVTVPAWTRPRTQARRLGPYGVLAELGRGGMSVVHLGVDPRGHEVAVKVLRPHVAGDELGRERLGREVRALLRVRGPHVAEVLDADVTGDPPYVVTRYVPGPSLDAVVREHGPLDEAALLHVAGGLAEALREVARGRSGAPGPEAGQRAAPRRRPGGHRLRHRAAGRRVAPDQRGPVRRHAGIPATGGRRRPGGRSVRRRLRLGGDGRLRGHRAAAVRLRAAAGRAVQRHAGHGGPRRRAGLAAAAARAGPGRRARPTGPPRTSWARWSRPPPGGSARPCAGTRRRWRRTRLPGPIPRHRRGSSRRPPRASSS